MRWFQFIATLSLQVGMIAYAASVWVEGGISVGSFAMVASLLLMVINDVRNLSRRFLEFFEYIGNITDGVGSHHPTSRDHRRARRRRTHCHARRDPVRERDFAYAEGDRGVSRVESHDPSRRTSGAGRILRFRQVDVCKSRLEALRHSGRHASSSTAAEHSEVTQNSLRRAVSMISQEPMLFHRSLRENVRYGSLDASDEDVQDAARRAHAHDFIEALPQGYGALVGERGVRLSGGQRQRIAIARAVLKNAPIVIMDEATSSLDSVTERHIQESIQQLMQGRTSVVIAHRLSTIAHLDRIVVFHAGQVVEDGTHAELLARNGHYATNVEHAGRRIPA